MEEELKSELPIEGTQPETTFTSEVPATPPVVTTTEEIPPPEGEVTPPPVVITAESLEKDYATELYQRIRVQHIRTGKKVFQVAIDDFKGLVLARFASGVTNTLSDNTAVTVLPTDTLKPGQMMIL